MTEHSGTYTVAALSRFRADIMTEPIHEGKLNPSGRSSTAMPGGNGRRTRHLINLPNDIDRVMSHAFQLASRKLSRNPDSPPSDLRSYIRALFDLLHSLAALSPFVAECLDPGLAGFAS
ncbi:hypothetical protein E1B28_002856 [Marasmius oreades]|uniref:Uncharacterized protein n=1 Tax=Marasmius oreades TaxID=181124 RepID=A0A9P7RNJ1_9AGAR|nr:uncharacterized protein E1B28_002856 [Marasmius oreades]KAG7086939.1 hypothetical protein E1B28_002856 [Marasmius oreades]